MGRIRTDDLEVPEKPDRIMKPEVESYPGFDRNERSKRARNRMQATGDAGANGHIALQPCLIHKTVLRKEVPVKNHNAWLTSRALLSTLSIVVSCFTECLARGLLFRNAFCVG